MPSVSRRVDERTRAPTPMPEPIQALCQSVTYNRERCAIISSIVCLRFSFANETCLCVVSELLPISLLVALFCIPAVRLILIPILVLSSARGACLCALMRC